MLTFALFLRSSDQSWFDVFPQRLEQLRYNPDFLAYLSHVLIFCTTEQDSHRAVAGLLLKNSLNQRTTQSSPNDAAATAYVKSTILAGLADKDHMIRQTVASVITALLSNEDAGAWPQALEALTQAMSSEDLDIMDVSALLAPCRSVSDKEKSR
jgi:transportin-1